jgi:hypothetical protein
LCDDVYYFYIYDGYAAYSAVVFAWKLPVLVTPGLTGEQATIRIKSIMNDVNVRIIKHFLGGQPLKQQLLNLQKFDFDPSQFNGAISPEKTMYGGKRRSAFKQDSDGEWLWFDKGSGTYKSIQ